ncbi:uncharacterized protein LOC124372442 [Homalodisca vitripennis]|uniref:uncharacterized protein LOC124372442 n=1 Tax=Homalodisca vitripennis TaxID=197043 RepID=UPI001EEB8C55|nr:uncharacterized protein LOC124372442 [Homalodisca vitripennis]
MWLTILIPQSPRTDTILTPGATNHDSVAQMIPELTRGATPLHIAAQRLHLECVSELIRRGAKVDLPDERGITPLDVVGELPPPHSGDVDGTADALLSLTTTSLQG